jgi:hypothetical protein
MLGVGRLPEFNFARLSDGGYFDGTVVFELPEEFRTRLLFEERVEKCD